MTVHTSCGDDNLDRALELVKSSKSRHESMGQYHQDLVKWARNVDKRYAWVVLAALWVIMAAALGPYRIYGLIFAKVTNEGFYTRQQASWPVSTILTVENIVGPLVSIVVYHISYRNSMLVGGILMALGNLLAYFSDSLWVDVIVLGFVQGVGFAFVFMPFMEIINSYFLKYRNIALGFSLCGGTISVFFFSPLFQWILEAFPWRTAYLGIAVVSCFIIITVPFLRPNPKPKQPAFMQKSAASSGANGLSCNKGSTLTRMSFRALSFQNSHRRQSTILISRDRTALDRQGSVISVNPFASSAGLERKISRSIVEYFQHPPQSQPQNQSPKSLSRQATQLSLAGHTTAAALDDAYETKSLSEIAQESESEFELSTILDILKTPGFHLIWYLELIYFWIFSILCLILVDFGMDHNCTRDQAETLLGFQSIGEIIGRMGLTILVDMHFLSNRNVVILNLCIIASLLVAITQVSGYVAIAALTVSINAFGSLLYILLNGLLVQFLGERQVTIGYGMASFVVGIMIIFRPQAVGYFRDTLGSYDWLLISLGIASALGAVLCVLETLVSRTCCKKKEQDNSSIV